MPLDRGGIETRLSASSIRAQVERERSRSLNTRDPDPDRRSFLVAIRAEERLRRERLQQGLPAHCIYTERLHRRIAEMSARK